MLRAKRFFATLFAVSLVAVGVSGPASSQVAVQDGLVNVAIGDVEVLNDARVAVAAKVAAQICGLKVGPVAVLGRAVDRTGDTSTVCEVPSGPVTIEQN